MSTAVFELLAFKCLCLMNIGSKFERISERLDQFQIHPRYSKAVNSDPRPFIKWFGFSRKRSTAPSKPELVCSVSNERVL